MLNVEEKRRWWMEKRYNDCGLKFRYYDMKNVKWRRKGNNDFDDNSHDNDSNDSVKRTTRFKDFNVFLFQWIIRLTIFMLKVYIDSMENEKVLCI